MPGKTLPTIGITMGDPSGVGPEVIIKALSNPGIRRLASFIVIGNRAVLRLAGKLNYPNVKTIDLKNVRMQNFRYGKISASFGKASIEYLNKAMELIRTKEIEALVTAPISKEAVHLAGYKWPGHTEYLAEKSGCRDFAMMFVGRELKVTLVTTHLPLKYILRAINPQKVFRAIKLTHHALKEFFGVQKPLIGVASVNPHGGEKGLGLGEERDSILPGLVMAKRAGFRVAGPVPADTLFYQAYNGKVDAVVAMYHDQGLAPFKMLYFDSGVNITLGLPFVRTSPDHGTGFDIAGRKKANASSMEEAIRLAVRLCKSSSVRRNV